MIQRELLMNGLYMVTRLVSLRYEKCCTAQHSYDLIRNIVPRFLNTRTNSTFGVTVVFATKLPSHAHFVCERIVTLLT